MGFCGSDAKNSKKKFLRFTIILGRVTKISGHIFHIEGPGKKYLSKNPYYQQLSGEKMDGNAPESGVEISKFVFYVLQSYWRS